jgi:hypothetical protein
VQKPHCRPCASRKAAWRGCSVPSAAARPSTVPTSTPVRLHGEEQAGAHGLAIQQHGARTTDAVLAPHVRAREPQLVAQEVAQEEAGLHGGAVRGTPLTVRAISWASGNGGGGRGGVGAGWVSNR